jgi:putative NIF3 family GTP cyclohydrolase 1 type 2
MATRQQLAQSLDTLLQPERFRDYGPNGLQVEGRDEVRRLVSGVTASRALIEAAIAAQADAVLVHHGLFWRGQDGRVTGWMKQRLALLLAHDINLFAYHLPLDAHPELGNNAQLARVLGLAATGRFGEQDLGFIGGRAGRRQLRIGGRAGLARGSGARARVTLVEGAGRGRSSGSPGAPAARRLLRGGHRRRRAGLPHRRDLRAAGALRARVRREPTWPAATTRPSATALRRSGAHVAGALGLEHRFIDVDNPA